MIHKKSFIGMVLLAVSQLLPAAEPDPVLVPTPRAQMLAVTANSRPFLGASRSQQPVDLAARGYAESELAVRGASGTGQSWVTRILVRRPRDARSFSGRVVVELLDATARYESAPLWGLSWEHFLRRGDAWVGVTISPAAVDTLKRFNAARYESLNLVASEAGGCGAVQQGGPAAGDVIAQVGALLRSSSKENPLLDLNPQRLIAAGYSDSGDHLTRYAVALHRGLRLGGDAPVFDGYLNVGGLAASTPACVAGLPRDVPFVSVLTGENLSFALDRSSGDKQDNQIEGSRVFEVAGAGAGIPPAGAPAPADLVTAGVKASAEAACREPIPEQILVHALNAIWQQLDELLVLKQPLINLPRLEPGLTGGSGGWRLPQADLPLAGVVPGRRSGTQSDSAPRVCNAVTGSMPRFDAATLKQLYRDRNEYLRRFNAAVDEAVKSRLLVKEDAASLKAAVARTTPAF